MALFARTCCQLVLQHLDCLDTGVSVKKTVVGDDDVMPFGVDDIADQRANSSIAGARPRKYAFDYRHRRPSTVLW
jgi:hypothetical protein